MSTITKLELQQINTRLATENAALRVQVADMSADLARLHQAIADHEAQLLNITSVASAVNTVRRMPKWQEDRAELMRVAKEMAMATRMVVKA